MTTGVERVADEAVRRGRAARWFLAAYGAAGAYAYVMRPVPDSGYLALRVIGLACFVVSARALWHGYVHRHREGRVAATIGVLAHPWGLLALVVLMMARVDVRDVTRQTR